MALRSFLFAFFAISLLIISVDASPFQPNDNSPEGIVLKMYKDFAWEAVISYPYDSLMDQPQSVLEKYFDKKLTSLILKDRACAKNKGICNLDFLPIWDSQDPSAGDLTVEKTNKPNIIAVSFRYPGTDKIIELKYQVTKTTKGWRISNISGKDWFLLSILSSPQ